MLMLMLNVNGGRLTPNTGHNQTVIEINLFILVLDETEYRNCIVWLEDQKIRHYKIEDRGNLRNIPGSEWPAAFQKVRWSPSTGRLG